MTDAERGYNVDKTIYSRCDLCKRFWKRAFQLTPEVKMHSFDNIIVCRHCIDKAGFRFVNEKKVAELIAEYDESGDKKE